tara:strand:+ start:636 stop:2042 length:1407 start_codon:yes stop_codon:yes gene_type:complete
MGIFDKIKKFGEQLEKKIENADDSIKKIDENLSNKDSVPTRDDIFTGMILYPKKKKNGKLVKAFSKDGQDFTSFVTSKRRQKAFSENKLLMAKVKKNDLGVNITWSLVYNEKERESSVTKEVNLENPKSQVGKNENKRSKKKGIVERALESTTKNRFEKVTAIFSTDQEALKEWKKYLRQYKNKKINVTTLRKKAKEIQEMGFRLTKASINADLAKIALQREIKKDGGPLSKDIKMASPSTTLKMMKGELGFDENWKLVKSHLEKFFYNKKGYLFTSSEIIDAIKDSGCKVNRLEHQDSFPSKKSPEEILHKLLKSRYNTIGIRHIEYKVGEHRNYFGDYFYIGEKERLAREKKENQKEERLLKNLKSSIVKLLKELGTKIPASDIDAHLKNKNVGEIKELCEKMYHDGEISRTSNYRYFVLTKKESKPTKSKQVDIGKELKKFKDLLDQELITQDDYDAKKKELLGL